MLGDRIGGFLWLSVSWWRLKATSAFGQARTGKCRACSFHQLWALQVPVSVRHQDRRRCWPLERTYKPKLESKASQLLLMLHERSATWHLWNLGAGIRQVYSGAPARSLSEELGHAFLAKWVACYM